MYYRTGNGGLRRAFRNSNPLIRLEYSHGNVPQLLSVAGLERSLVTRRERSEIRVSPRSSGIGTYSRYVDDGGKSMPHDLSFPSFT